MYWPAINSIIVLSISLIIILAFNQLLRKVARADSKIDELKTQLGELSEQVVIYENITHRQQQQLTELNKTLTACFSPIEDLEKQIEQVDSKVQLIQSEIDSESNEQKLYGRAKKMIEMGADIEELISECEVPRAEAELLLSLYRVEK